MCEIPESVRPPLAYWILLVSMLGYAGLVGWFLRHGWPVWLYVMLVHLAFVLALVFSPRFARLPLAIFFAISALGNATGFDSSRWAMSLLACLPQAWIFYLLARADIRLWCIMKRPSSAPAQG
jgi:hypothetical protein